MTDAPLPPYDASDPAAYVASRLALIGDRDPLPLLEAAPARLGAALEGFDEAAATTPEAPGAWSVLQVVRHLADSEVVYGYRLRLIVAAAPGTTPEIPGYDQEAWADRLPPYHEGSVADALADYAAARRVTVRLLRSLPEADWERAGRHSERGRETVRQIATLLAAHDLGHERQVARVRAALSA